MNKRTRHAKTPPEAMLPGARCVIGYTRSLISCSSLARNSLDVTLGGVRVSEKGFGPKKGGE